jgi:hypothetical protein
MVAKWIPILSNEDTPLVFLKRYGVDTIHHVLTSVHFGITGIFMKWFGKLVLEN